MVWLTEEKIQRQGFKLILTWLVGWLIVWGFLEGWLVWWVVS